MNRQRPRLLTVQGFLPPDLLERWRSHCERAELPGADGEWSYTTNEGTAKTRSNEDRDGRRSRVEAAYQRGEFAYSKWEPLRSSAFYLEVQRYMESPETLARLAALLGEESVRISDVYVTIFQRDDFLGRHEDRDLGSYAFTISLSSLAEDEGGRLRLYTAPEGDGAPSRIRALLPHANELVIFALGPEPLPHDVERVTGTTRRSTLAGFVETGDFTSNRCFVQEAAGVDVAHSTTTPL